MCALEAGANNSHYDAVEILLELELWTRPDAGQSSSEFRALPREMVLRSTLVAAVTRGDIRMAGLLVKCCSSSSIQAALPGAVETNGTSNMVKLLLDASTAKGTDNSEHGYLVGLAAEKAVSRGDFEIVKLLLDRGNETDAGRALRTAVNINHVDFVKLCAKHTCRFDTIEAPDQAARGGQFEILEALMECLDQASNARSLLNLPFDIRGGVLEAMLNRCGPNMYAQIFARAASLVWSKCSRKT